MMDDLHRTARRGAAVALAGAVLAGQAVGAGAAGAAERLALPDLVDKVSPAVVTVMTMDAQESRGSPVPEGSPFGEFFRRFAPEGMPGGEQRERVRRGLGSGFVYDPDGLIVTNSHVVDGADRVKVRMVGGASYEAEIVGSDDETDLALLRVEADADLPSISLGDSDAVRVGETVAAVGNPFGLSTTVTKGIISAAGRMMPGGNYVDFLQTDAAINRGNSGGPLFNMSGEVIGVNTSIVSPSGGNVGIGFAVPSNIVANVVSDLLDDGAVARGWLGVSIQPVTREIADAMSLTDTEGALVANVMADSPAEGVLRTGDVIVGFEGEPVGTSRDLPRLVGGADPGSEVGMTVRRDGERRTVSLTLGALSDYRQAARGDRGGDRSGDAPETAALGARLAPLTPETRRRLELSSGVEGAVIAELAPGSRAAQAGLRPGDVIERVGNTAVASPDDVRAALGASDARSALFLVNRGGNRIFVGVPLAG